MKHIWKMSHDIVKDGIWTCFVKQPTFSLGLIELMKVDTLDMPHTT